MKDHRDYLLGLMNGLAMGISLAVLVFELSGKL